MWPPPDEEYVNFAAWVHVSDWAAVSATAAAGPVSATVTATPVRVVMSSPDSTDGGNTYQTQTTTCAGPGPVYDPNSSGNQSSPCSFTWSWPSANYNPSGTYPFQMTLIYQVSWRATGAPGGGTLAPIEASSTVTVRVNEMEALGR
jgi:hypothetical protein